mmetsp:Transcript_32251/g.23806  ORF Transcript_32251/g.23806 Transcript_32251/m.23806 type:complete len:98 (+) Transcript_32251:143-436(+)
MAVAHGPGCDLGKHYYAHRGDVLVAQENTLAAGLSAASKGWAIETDIFYTTDGVVVNYHDDNFLALTGHDVDISDAAWAGQVENYKYFKVLKGFEYA